MVAAWVRLYMGVHKVYDKINTAWWLAYLVVHNDLVILCILVEDLKNVCKYSKHLTYSYQRIRPTHGDCRQVLESTAFRKGLAIISIPWLYQPLHHARTPWFQRESKHSMITWNRYKLSNLHRTHINLNTLRLYNVHQGTRVILCTIKRSFEAAPTCVCAMWCSTTVVLNGADMETVAAL